jgi:TldD protein
MREASDSFFARFSRPRRANVATLRCVATIVAMPNRKQVAARPPNERKARPKFEAPFAAGQQELSRELMQSVLERALAHGADFADLYAEYRRSSAISMEDGQIRTVSGGVDMGVGIRVVCGSAIGFSYAENLEPRELMRAAENASRIAKSGHRATEALRSRKVADRYSVCDEVVDLAGEEQIAILRRADKACRQVSSEISRVDASLVSVHKEILIATSDGVLIHDVQPMMRISISTVATRGKRTESGSSSGGGRQGLEYFTLHTPEEHGKEAARVALVNLESQDAPAGVLPVVLAAGDSGILLHEAVGHGLEADFNRKRTSNYTDQIGNEVASSLVTVIDDPAIAGSRGSINVDDEGVQAQEHELIVGGKLVGYLHDKISARHFKLKHSGSGRRESFRDVPLPRMSNTYMRAGASDPQEIIASVDRGIYAVKYSGGQVNISNGDFVFSLTEGYLIENGKIGPPLKGVNLIGNGPSALRCVSMVGTDFSLSDGMWTCGKDGQSVPVGVGMPTVKLDRLTVGGTKV